jgi:YHS domain-containing protein
MFSLIERLIFLLIVISAIRSVVRFVQGIGSGLSAHTRSRVNPSAGAARRGNEGAATVLQQDPVCGTYVAIDSSFKKVSNGQVIHFCSQECRDKYRA